MTKHDKLIREVRALEAQARALQLEAKGLARGQTPYHATLDLASHTLERAWDFASLARRALEDLSNARQP